MWEVSPSHAIRAVVPAGRRMNATAGAGTERRNFSELYREARRHLGASCPARHGARK